ncbi:MAG TPA: CoA transferase [Acidimicrobiales bacterium]|nr:CoA transferase [Acidimicrobiales bacterium]
MAAQTGSGALGGVRVLELGGGVAVAYCGKLLTDQGADVVKVEPAEGDALRSWRASDPDHRAPGTSALFRYLNTSKRSVTVAGAALDTLVPWADVVVAGDGAPSTQAGSGTVVVSLSAFGPDGPLAGTPWTELTLQGWCGSISARGFPDRPPLQQGGRAGEWLGGATAAFAALAGISHRAAHGVAPRLDVPLLEVMAVCLVTYPTLYRDFTGAAAALSQRGSDYPSVERCKDGWIGLCLFSAQQWADFAVMIGRPELAEDTRLNSMAGRGRNRDLARSVIDPWLADHTADEIFELGGLFRVPVSYVGNGRTLPEMEHFRERGVFVENPGGGFIQPRSPFLMSATPVVALRPAPEVGADTDAIRAEAAAVTPPAPAAPDWERDPTPRERPLAGVTILDFTAYWSGPAGTHLLCALGAEVVKIESFKRPDGIRFGTVAPPEQSDWLERSPIYQGANPGKRSVAIDVTTPEGRDLVLRLASRCDGVWENFTPRVMGNLGLTYEDLRAVNPGVIMVRIPGFGLEGPWRDHAGFAQTMEQVSGMGWLTGYADRNPLVRTTCDPAAGVHAAFAFLCAVHHRRVSGEGQLIEMPMVEVALNIAAEQVVEQSAYGRLLDRDANRGPVGAPQGVYPCAGEEQWVALAVVDDDQWVRLCALLPDGAWGRSPELVTRAGRRTAHDRIDAELAKWLSGQDRDAVVRDLTAAGIPAAPVWPQTHIDAQPQLVHAGFFQTVGHPTIGPVGYPGIGVRSDAVDTSFTGPAPLLGQHTAEVLAGMLGCSDAELAGLAERGVVGLR